MKDKLEVGHFIRTIKGIGRIEEITEDRTEIYFNCDTGLTISFIKKETRCIFFFFNKYN